MDIYTLSERSSDQVGDDNLCIVIARAVISPDKSHLMDSEEAETAWDHWKNSREMVQVLSLVHRNLNDCSGRGNNAMRWRNTGSTTECRRQAGLVDEPCCCGK